MSIASLMVKKDFKHSLQDEMESFYYIILYASIVGLPHENLDDVEGDISGFFDEHKVHKGKLLGGRAKNSNRFSSDFYDLWEFKNDALKNWLEVVLQLQYKSDKGEQLKWTPKALCDQWKITDEDDLPVNDRVHNTGVNASTRGKSKPNTNTPSATQVSAHISRPSQSQSQSTSRKRLVDETDFEEHSEALKRQWNTPR